MAYGEPLLSKICDDNNVRALTRYGIEREHFDTPTERAAYEFIKRYADENRGDAPSYATLVGEIPDFVYIPDVSDSYEYLARKIKDAAGKRQIKEFVETELPEIFRNNDTETLISELTERFESIRMGTSVRKTVGLGIGRDTDRFLAEYRERKAGKSFRIWQSKFPGINDQIGGYYSSNMYTWYARSGRGKSVITMEEALESAFQGACVLIWALEMSSYEWMARAYSSISAREGLLTAEIDGQVYEAGFENRSLLSGKLTEDMEAGLETFLSTLNDVIPGKIILRATDDEDFRDRSLRQLDADIIETGADVVVVDPFYYLDYERNTSRITGGDAANTSKKLRYIAGRTKAVIHAITQADEDEKEKGADGVRELRAPKRAEIKKTKQLLEDAANTFGIDTLAHEGRGVIELGKGRNGGEDTRVEILYLPNFGIVRELDIAEELAEKF